MIFAIILSSILNISFLLFHTKKQPLKYDDKLKVKLTVIKKEQALVSPTKIDNKNSNGISFSNLGVGEIQNNIYFKRNKFGENRNPYIEKIQSKTFKIYNQINNSLNYPQYFKECEISGVVNTRLYFNSRGRYIASNSKYNSNSRYLRYHVLKTIENLYENKKVDVKDVTVIDASFIFDLYADPNYQYEQNITNIFIFYRSINREQINVLMSGGVFNILGIYEIASRNSRRKKAQIKYKNRLNMIKSQKEF